MCCLLFLAAPSSLSFLSLSGQIKPFPATLQRIISTERLRTVFPKQELLLTLGRVARSNPRIAEFPPVQSHSGRTWSLSTSQGQSYWSEISGVLTWQSDGQSHGWKHNISCDFPQFSVASCGFFRFWPFPTLAFCEKLLKTQSRRYPRTVSGVCIYTHTYIKTTCNKRLLHL